MMIRSFLLLLVCTVLTARASDPISAAVGGASATVTQPHVTAELIPETTTIEPGKPFGVALHLHMDSDWHTYWINPGDSGLATTIKWTLPPGFTAGPIQWPTPEIHKTGTLIAYGYEGDVYLLTTITPPKSDLPRHFEVKARASWLVCKEECIPGKAELTLPLDSGTLNLRLPIENTEFFAAAKARLPVKNTTWNVVGAYGAKDEPPHEKVLRLLFELKPGAHPGLNFEASFFPEQANVLQSVPTVFGFDPAPTEVVYYLPLQQNGETPSQLSGVLIPGPDVIGKAIYISNFSTTSDKPEQFEREISEKMKSYQSVAAAVPSGVSASSSTSGSPDNSLSGSPQATRSSGSTTTQPLLIAVLLGAFIGGLILNLMPCVLPVLSLKVFSLTKHAGEDPRGAWKQGVAFTLGVLLSFWALAGLLLVLRAFGNQLGWGFQMQSPGFIIALIFIFFLLGLNLFGLFEFGTSLVGLDAKVTGRSHGLTSSFLNGALATLAATPCTGPFMGSALGFAAQQPAYIALLVFTFLALGMAAPYLLLAIFPAALRFVPKPGAWMEAFKQFMGFLLMGTVIFLVYIFGALVGEDRVPWLLGALLLASIAAWIYGRWFSTAKPLSERIIPLIFVLIVLGVALKLGIYLALAPVEAATMTQSTQPGSLQWKPWTPAAVDEALAQGHPVFVDFTAAWCANCKVNEAYALGNDEVKKTFADKNVTLFKADWTRPNADIANTLRQFNRDGVPLYLLYSPKDKANPQVLPDGLISPGVVLDALHKL